MSRSSAVDPIFHVKDGLRRLRYRVRRTAAGESDSPLSFVVPSLPQPLALVADSVLSVAEAVRDVLTRESGGDGRGLRSPAPIDDYVALAAAPRESFQAFTSLAYRAFKSLALRFGAREILVSELALERARRSFADGLQARRGPRPAPGRTPATVRECAALAAALAAARPITRFVPDEHRSDLARHFVEDPNVFVACGIGLSAYMAAPGRRPKQRDANSALVTAEAAVDARFEAIVKALAAPNPVDALTAEFSVIVSFLY